jgi:hypothetical protein
MNRPITDRVFHTAMPSHCTPLSITGAHHTESVQPAPRPSRPAALGETPVATLRPLPHPYRAMIAICSDLDETPDKTVYCELIKFLNTDADTAMGPGVNLEVGNTIYFNMPPDQFSYWNTDDAGRNMIRTLIQSGHIDCLHSYGDLAVTRDHAARALDDLRKHGCYLRVWIDHAVAPTNFDPTIMHGHGDDPAHPAYHADLTVAQGVRYVWRGRVTSVVGQNVPLRLAGIWTPNHPVASAKTAAKETAKQLLARIGSAKYALHAPNRILNRSSLRDGTPIYEFLRCNPHWGGVSFCETAKGIGQVLTDTFLNRLIRRQGVCILYTHLGKIHDSHTPFCPEAVAGFRRLAAAHHRGDLLVSTTRRLLGFCRAAEEVQYACSTDAQGLRIDIDTRSPKSYYCGELDLADLHGLTFDVPDPAATRIVLNGRLLEHLQRNAPDHTGSPSISIPRPGLEFPQF